MAVTRNNRKSTKNKSSKELTGLVIVIISGLFLFCICIPQAGGVAAYFIRRLTLGIFGFMAFPILIALVMLGIAFMRNLTLRLELRYVVGVSIISFLVALVLQLATSKQYINGSFVEYIAAIYDSENNFTGGGVFFGIFVYGVQSALTIPYSYVMYVLAIMLTAFFMAKDKLGSQKKSKKQEPEKETYRFEKGSKPVQTVKPMADKSLFVDLIRPINKPYESSGGGFSSLLEKEKPKNMQSYSTPLQKAKASLYNDVNPDKHSKAMNIFNEIKNTPIKDIPSKNKQLERNVYEQSYYEPSLPSLSSLAPDVKEQDEPKMEDIAKKPPKIVHFDQSKPSLPIVPMPPPKDMSASFVGGEIINGETLSKKLADERAPLIPAQPIVASFDTRKSEPQQAVLKQDSPKEQIIEPEIITRERPPIVNGTYFTEMLEREKLEQEKLNQRHQKLKEEFGRAKPSAVPNPPLHNTVKNEKAEQSYSIDELNPSKKDEKPISEQKHEPSNNYNLIDINDDEQASESMDFSAFDLSNAKNNLQSQMRSLNDEDSTSLSYNDDEEVIDLSEKIYLDNNNDYTGYYNEVQQTSKASPHDTFKPIQKLKPENQIKMEDYSKVTALKEAKEEKQKPKNRIEKYNPPPLTLLKASVSYESEDFALDSQEKAQILEETLRGLKLPATVNLITRGPSVTRYELEMPPGIPVKRIAQFAKDIEYNLASNGRIRIETPIPGKRAVGIEVPNESVDIVRLKEIIGSKEFVNSPSVTTLALGKDIAGSNILCCLEKMPHLLIAGATGSGKSACLNSIIVSILYKSSPEDARIILIDPKHVEFTIYQGLPHLLTSEIITDAQAALNAFKWLKSEMDRRYHLFRQHVVRNLAEYNKLDDVKNGDLEKLPSIVLIVDELAELMQSNNRKDLEEKIMSMAQLARAAGIHLILATQRPSVDVITGTIKSNLPSRIAFAVKSVIDSRTILDQSGADTLLGNGDMLYAPLGLDDPRRVQGAYVTNDEVVTIVNYIKENNSAVFDDEFTDSLVVKEEQIDTDTDAEESEFDPLMTNVLKLVIETGTVSTTFIQRRFAVGYARASRIIDQMEINKFIGPLEGSKPRPVYITREQFKEIFGEEL